MFLFSRDSSFGKILTKLIIILYMKTKNTNQNKLNTIISGLERYINFILKIKIYYINSRAEKQKTSHLLECDILEISRNF